MNKSKFQKSKLTFLILALGVIIFIGYQGLSAISNASSLEKNPILYQKYINMDKVKKPRLLDLGAENCVSCKMMVPVLAALKNEFGDNLQVDFINVLNESLAQEYYNVQVIPTQIFFNANGRERYRHVGPITKTEIINKFHELGIELIKDEAQKN